MRVVLQVVKQASVSIENKIAAEIKKGLLILVGIEDLDTEQDLIWLSNKIANMRVFTDSKGVMNLSVKDIDGEILVVSQFTLQASTKKGHRPSYLKASKAEVAIPKYQQFVSQLQNDLGKTVETGVFGADMEVALINQGPVTIILDSKNKC